MSVRRRIQEKLQSKLACASFQWTSVQGGSDKVLGLHNTSTFIIAFLTFQLRLYVLAHCASRLSVSTLSHTSALYFVHAPGMTPQHIFKETDDGLGLAVELFSWIFCHRLWQHFLGIISTNYIASATSGIFTG